MRAKVCCVIISYNDFECLISTVEQIHKQVEEVIIVDNGSKQDIKEKIRLIEIPNTKTIFNEKNLGIAKALNIGIAYAKENKYDYVLTLDQDSSCKEDMVTNLLQTFVDNENTYIASPLIEYQDFVEKDKVNHYDELDYVITSGNLIPIEIFDVIGGYEEKLFIDSVDFDFSLRVKNSKGRIVQNNYAVMRHRLGEFRVINILGYKKKYFQHNPVRNYYIFRNSIYLYKNYCFSNGTFCMKKFFFTSKLFVDNMLFHTNKKAVIGSMLKGIKDGVLNKYD